jgi:4-hydroxy-tetrahydrodipicolinate reductase
MLILGLNFLKIQFMDYIIIGYGKMGKAIEEVAYRKGHNLLCCIDNKDDWSKNENLIKSANIAFEFTQPDTAVDNIKRCFSYNLPVVCGTTGWFNHLEEIKNLCISTGNTLFFAGNFSIGVNIMMEVNKQLAEIMNKMPQYDVIIEETHHIHKLDAPSGTALLLADDIYNLIDRLNICSTSKNDRPKKIDIMSYREGEIAGIHNVIYESEFDKIELKHTSKNRKGLAQGAVIAAEWVIDKKGFYTMFDMIGFGNK